MEPWIFRLLGFAILAAMVWSIVSLFRGGKELYCTSCGHQGKTRYGTRGSLLIEIVLWLCLIVPGLIYSIWRHSTKRPVCRACGADTIIPPQSPLAIKMRRDLAPKS